MSSAANMALFDMTFTLYSVHTGAHPQVLIVVTQ
jgi:hypothetical protein